MKTRLLSTAAALALSASAAFPQSIAEQVIAQLQAEGYQRIEVRNGPSQVKVEAIRDGMKMEVVYDALTGAVVKHEVERVDADEDTTPGVRVRNNDRDFVDDEGDDTDDGDEFDDDSDDDDEDDSDDDDEDDDEDDDDRGRDRNRDRDRGGDHDDEGDDDDGDDDDDEDDD